MGNHGGCTVTFCSTYFIYHHIGRDWMPQEDQNELGVYLELPKGLSLEATEKVTLEIANQVEQLDSVVAAVPQSSTGLSRVTMSYITVLLKPTEERGSISEMGRRVRAVTSKYPSTRPRITFPNVLGGRDTFTPVRGMLLGPDGRVVVAKALALRREGELEPQQSGVSSGDRPAVGQ